MTKIDELQAALDAVAAIPESPRGGNEYLLIGRTNRMLRKAAPDLLAVARAAQRYVMASEAYDPCAPDSMRLTLELSEASKALLAALAPLIGEAK